MPHQHICHADTAACKLSHKKLLPREVPHQLLLTLWTKNIKKIIFKENILGTKSKI